MEIVPVQVDKPEATNFIFGQAHFIKTVEDLHEAIVQTAPHIRFGLAFCESSGPALIRHSGNDQALVELAIRNAQAVGAGHSFFVFLEGGYPINILNAIKALPEVCRIYCATANPAVVIVADNGVGRAVLGVVDGISPRGVEGAADTAERVKFLRSIGYKLG